MSTLAGSGNPRADILEIERALPSAEGEDRVRLLSDLAAKLTASDAPRARRLAVEAVECSGRCGDDAGGARAMSPSTLRQEVLRPLPRTAPHPAWN